MMGVPTARKPNGVLPVSSIPTSNDTPKATKAKDPPRGKKVLVRRLPPGITEEEFRTILRKEWKSGNGKVEWTKFQEGQISQDPSNPSTPARCYLQVRSEDIPALAEAVQRSTWEDEKRTFNDSALVGPPYLEVSIYQKVPTTKRRTDSKQGTIDQDPDFMAFLDSLTQDSNVKEVDAEQADDLGKTDTKVTTTPLVEYLKEKKANKGKDTSNTKSGKHTRHESQGGKPKGGQEDSKRKGKDSKAEKAEKAADKEEKKAKEPVKLLTKKPTVLDSAEATRSTSAQASTSKTTEEAIPKSRRANIAAAAKILQRDLGLSPGSAHRRARQDAAKAEAAAKVDVSKEKDTKDSASTAPAAPSQPSSSAPPSAPTAPKAQTTEGSRRSRGSKSTKQNVPGDIPKGKGTDNASSTAKSTPITTPVILKRKDDAPSSGLVPTAPATQASSTSTPPTGPKAANKAAPSNKSGPSQKKASGQPLVTAGAMRAFVKHANPSQGVTEPLLKQAMETFGPVTFVEIDKRKGFAYVDFRDHDGLVKAISASPIPVAQGTVQVLERKEIKKPTPTPTQPASDKTSNETPPDRPKRGGRGRGRRGGAANAGSTNPTNEAVGSSATPPPQPTEPSTAVTAD
ncbi:putative nonsense-mediated mrna decay protein [Daldinia childiae]|uniref:putative nonsense-mediated mrna decay protein n=1 Tax=Daldinia childiae TaxID=326645 RepID=UPI001446F328|nr:putative nonsense-mediated mrna decay protein [Daldinia childiae]KAF3071060.1 putative nonsense-mediated mrna decay protein [Daldinia childiae]